MSTTAPVTILGISKPSQAIRAMIAGLLDMAKEPDFEIRMTTFGGVAEQPGGNRVCHGCAATCALQKLLGRRLTEDELDFHVTPGRYFETHNFDTMGEVSAFEDAMDNARSGNYEKLFYLFEMEYPDEDEVDTWPDLTMLTENWKDEIPKAETLARLWEAAGY